jgi:hypothetical protein
MTVIGFAAERLMEMEVAELTCVARSPERLVRRNGIAPGSALRIPKLRRGSCLPGFLEPRRVAEKAWTADLAVPEKGAPMSRPPTTFG